MCADELRRQSDQFVDIVDLKDQICRDHGSKGIPIPEGLEEDLDEGLEEDELVTSS
jgi:hypothetical protein